MRVLQARTKRTLDLLAIGSGGHVAAASSTFGVRGDVEVWEIASGKLVLTHPGDEREVACISFAPGGHKLFVGEEDELLILDPIAQTGCLVPSLEFGWSGFGFPEFAFSADGTRLFICETLHDLSRIKLVSIDAQMKCNLLWLTQPLSYTFFSEPAFAPASAQVAVSVHDATRNQVRNAVQIREAATGTVQFEIEFGASNPLQQVGFSADGSKVLARSSGRTVKVFDAATGQPVGDLVHPGRPYVTGIAVHPNGTVACSRNNGTVCLWHLDKRELVRTLDWKLGKLVSVAFSPDGTIGAAGTEDGQVIVWDVD